MSTRPSPAAERSRAALIASVRDSRSRAVLEHDPAQRGDGDGFGPPGRSKTAPPTVFSRAGDLLLTVDWV
ncbi:hypothetical protein GCM10020218_103760 [Dactylosporangium vinaceum]